MYNMTFRKLYPLIALLAAAIGCDSGPAPPPLGTVTGNVTLDGKPAEGMAVIFTPDSTRSSTGLTDKDGNYSLEFDKDHKGAAVGKHKVQITQRLEADPAKLAASRPEPGAAPRMIPARYNDKSTLEREVKPGANTFDFDLTSEP